MSTGDGMESDPDPSATGSPTTEATAIERPAVTMCRTSPGRSVFTEQGNTDAWIATSLTVDLDR